MTEFNPITTLKINGEDVEAKALFAFDIKAKKFSEETKGKNGETIVTPGFNIIYNGILERDTNAIANFWECATAYLSKNAPSREDIENALAEVISEKEDTLELLQGALNVLNNSGFFKQKSKMFWIQMNKAPQMAKAEDKETTKADIEFMKENYKEIMDAEPYSITQK